MESSGRLATRDVFLAFGAKERGDLFGLAELEGLASRMPRFRFVPVLQEPDAEWKGARGLVTDAIAALLAEAGEAATSWQAALCGSPGMVKACERVLARHGIQGEALRRDSFA
jgi:Na+-transporting NADH:ubiquinone oxidoreductase subunit F